MRLLDQMGNVVDVPESPRRIVSLVPSQTELLYDLGLDDSIIGITKFCVHPKHLLKSKKIIGGTKNFNFEAIDELQPDLIIGNKEENYEEGIAGLSEKYPVWMSDIITIGDSINMIRSLSTLTNTKDRGMQLIGSIHKSFKDLKPVKPVNVLYLMWRDPWMGVAGKTFINSMIEQIGLKNVLKEQDRYPVLSDDRIRELDPSVVLLSSEPFPFSQKHIEEVKSILPSARVILVDGEMFSWYGTRMINTASYFNSIEFEG